MLPPFFKGEERSQTLISTAALKTEGRAAKQTLHAAKRKRGQSLRNNIEIKRKA